MTVKRIGPASAFRVGLAVYGFLGLVVGLLVGMVSMLAGSMESLLREGAPGASVVRFAFGFGAIIVFPVMYDLVGGIFAAIGAAIYNLVVRWVGGLELEMI